MINSIKRFLMALLEGIQESRRYRANKYKT